MDRLRAHFEGLGLDDVSTYIASGNVLFESGRAPAELEPKIEGMLETELGYGVDTFLRTPAQLKRVLKVVDLELGEPGAGESIFVTFMKRTPSKTARSTVERLSNDDDVLKVASNHLLWLRRGPLMEATVDGMGLEKTLGQPGTMRNANTVRKILAKLVV